MGERAAVERLGCGAQSACRRRGGEPPAHRAPHGGGSTRTGAVALRLGRIAFGGSISGKKWDLGFGF
jgi:hypothetical protein